AGQILVERFHAGQGFGQSDKTFQKCRIELVPVGCLQLGVRHTAKGITFIPAFRREGQGRPHPGNGAGYREQFEKPSSLGKILCRT
ncbi:MAG TPA: hypothetical protein VG815_15925, partial [Chloroflexota bacterium]|nr:hypothetical protein [Chloroflexota bacterium]